jgi:uncharacterized RDD family membrane protein YckC
LKAGIARRFAAQISDAIAAWGVFFVIFLLSAAAGSAVGSGSASQQDQGIGAFFGTFILAFMGYIVFALWFLAQGKTPGKWFVGIRVVDKMDGQNPGLGRMLVREIIGKIVSGFFFGLGYFWAIWDLENQAWHDKIAGTLVVRQIGLKSQAPTGTQRVGTVSFRTASPSAVGAPLSAAIPSVNQLPEATSPTQSLFCTDCGTRAQSESRFCEECGAPLDVSAI